MIARDVGFAFDSYELLMLPLIVRPALIGSAARGAQQPGGQRLGRHALQYVPAVAGGIFGLLGGYLTDLFGRRRVLVWSILLYALSATFAAGYVDVGRAAAVLALLHVRRRLRGIRRGGGVARGAVPRSQAARARRRLHAGVRIDRRLDGHRRVLPGGDLRAHAAGRFAAATKRGDTR